MASPTDLLERLVRAAEDLLVAHGEDIANSHATGVCPAANHLRDTVEAAKKKVKP